MTLHALKKLVTTFLVLAVGTTSLVLVFSRASQETQHAPREEASAATGNAPADHIPRTAFVEPLPKVPRTIAGAGGNTREAPGDGEPPLIAEAGNLTYNLIQRLTSELLNENPNGPQAFGDKLALTAPSADTLNDIATQSVAQFSIDDYFAPPTGDNIKILDSYTPEGVGAYLAALHQIFSDTIESRQFEDLSQNEITSLGDIDVGRTIVAHGTERVLALPVPAPLADLHTRVLTFFTDQERIFDAAAGVKSDPLKTLAVLEHAGSVISRDTLEMRTAYNELEFGAPSAHGGGTHYSLGEHINILFGVRTVHAFIFVPTDCIGPACTSYFATNVGTNTMNTTHRIFEYIKKLALQVLKDQLIHNMTQQVVNWVQGGGKPKFITNWRGFFTDQLDQSIGRVLLEVNPRICEPFRPLATALLELPQNPLREAHSRCRLSDVVDNIRDWDPVAFRNDFSQGGWKVYTATLHSTGNIFGEFLELHDIVGKEAARAERDAQAQANSSKGFFGTRQCVKEEELPPGVAGPPRCLEYRITTPGSFIADTLGPVLGDSPVKRIVNADDVLALVTALSKAAITQFINISTGRDRDNDPGLVPASGEDTFNPTIGGDPCGGTEGAARSQCLVENGCSGATPDELDGCLQDLRELLFGEFNP